MEASRWNQDFKLCVGVYVCVCMCICMCVCLGLYVCVFLCTETHCVSVCVSACGYVYIHVGKLRDQGFNLEMELLEIVRHQTWMLAAKLRASGRAAPVPCVTAVLLFNFLLTGQSITVCDLRWQVTRWVLALWRLWVTITQVMVLKYE